MRISDWSSDVCSSDLGVIALAVGQPTGWIPLAIAPLIAAGAWISAHFHGWAEVGEMVAIRSGWIKPKTTLLPFASVQSVDLATDSILRPLGLRSEARRVGKEWVSTFRFRWSPY